MPLFQIKSWRNGALLYECECESLKRAVEAAVKDGANLAYANLRYADLVGADLVGANLVGANLVGANLVGANLVGAGLRYADLRRANLRGASLRYANLADADLAGANLTDANLTCADLACANLTGANLDTIRDDLYRVLDWARAEAPAFLAALREGRIDGRLYEGECACLVGTIAKVRGVDYASLEHDANRPIEMLLTAVRSGDTPETNQVAALVAEWTEQFIEGEG